MLLRAASRLGARLMARNTVEERPAGGVLAGGGNTMTPPPDLSADKKLLSLASHEFKHSFSSMSIGRKP